MTLLDTMEQIERKLDKGDLDPLNRRLMLRKFLTELQREAFDAGHHEGMRDANDAQFAAERAAKAAAGG